MRTIFSFAAAFALLPLAAQVAHGGQPIAWGQPLPVDGAIPEVALSGLDRNALIVNETSAVPGGIKYGTQRMVAIDVAAQGERITLGDQRTVCRFIVRSPGAVMLSVQFSVFDLGPNSWVYLYNEDRSFFIGGFTQENELATGDLATAVVPGDAVVIELIEPEPPVVPSVLHVASITHGYRDIFHFGEQGFLRDYDPGYQSAPCHNNVICPIASAWQQQKRSVAMFLRPDGDGCTATLLNNTAQNGTPYMYLANHCYTGSLVGWVFYFNYDSPTCVGSTGPTSQTITGGTLKSNYYFDDFVLMQLSSTPPSSYQPFYAGWDRSGTTPSNQTVILHPLYDVKKISFDNNPATSYSVVPYVGAPETIKLWRNYWDSGIVEPVGSGAPLFDQNKRLVGHMFEGAQNCTNSATVSTGCAKFSESWDGSAASIRVRDWLDPANSAITLNGYDPYATVPLVRVRIRAMLEGPYDTGTQLMNGTLRSSALIPLNEPYTGLGYTHAGGGGGESTTNGVLNVSGSNSIVDWVVLELRDKNNSASILATRSALIQRDGDIVDVDGTSDVTFNNRPADDYYIAVRHRNHLGIMSQNPIALTTTASLNDFSNGAVSTHGGTIATTLVGTKRCLWAGDVNRNNVILYTGTQNDRDPILTAIGGTIPTNTVNGYLGTDVNLDGVVSYTGAGNDRDILLVNIGGTVPTNSRAAQLP